MANSFKTGIPAKVQALVNGITTALGNSSNNLNFANSVGFKIILELSPDGQTISMRAYPLDQGPSLKPAFKVDTVKLP